MDLQVIRERIDQVDKELVRLLEERMRLVSQVAAYKQEKGLPVLDSSREQLILDRVVERLKESQYEASIRATFADILNHSRAYQEQFLAEPDDD